MAAPSAPPPALLAIYPTPGGNVYHTYFETSRDLMLGRFSTPRGLVDQLLRTPTRILTLAAPDALRRAAFYAQRLTVETAPIGWTHYAELCKRDPPSRLIDLCELDALLQLAETGCVARRSASDLLQHWLPPALGAEAEALLDKACAMDLLRVLTPARGAVFVFKAGEAMLARAAELAPRSSEGHLLPQLPGGPLGATLRLRARLALNQPCSGIPIDSALRVTVASRLRARRDELIAQLRSWPGDLSPIAADLDTPSPAALGRPVFAPDRLTASLQRVVQELGERDGRLYTTPAALNGETTVALQRWRSFGLVSPFVRRVFQLIDTCRLLRAAESEAPLWRPAYACSVAGGEPLTYPPLEALPRSGGCRAMIAAAPYDWLISLDLRGARLALLAALLQARYGRSALAAALTQQSDPVRFTAAGLIAAEPADLRAVQATHPDEVRFIVDLAALLLDGVSRGMSNAVLADIAADNGIVVSVAEVAQYRQKLVTRVYRELEAYQCSGRLEGPSVLLPSAVVSPSGRIRSGLGTAEATGALLAEAQLDLLYLVVDALDRARYRVAFVTGDEVVLLSYNPDQAPRYRDSVHIAQANLMKGVCRTAMKALTGDIPVPVRVRFGPHWDEMRELAP